MNALTIPVLTGAPVSLESDLAWLTSWSARSWPRPPALATRATSGCSPPGAPPAAYHRCRRPRALTRSWSGRAGYAEQLVSAHRSPRMGPQDRGRTGSDR